MNFLAHLYPIIVVACLLMKFDLYAADTLESCIGLSVNSEWKHAQYNLETSDPRYELFTLIFFTKSPSLFRDVDPRIIAHALKDRDEFQQTSSSVCRCRAPEYASNIDKENTSDNIALILTINQYWAHIEYYDEQTSHKKLLFDHRAKHLIDGTYQSCETVKCHGSNICEIKTDEHGSSYPWMSAEPIESAQSTAIEEHKKNPLEIFQLVIDLKKFRRQPEEELLGYIKHDSLLT